MVVFCLSQAQLQDSSVCMMVERARSTAIVISIATTGGEHEQPQA